MTLRLGFHSWFLLQVLWCLSHSNQYTKRHAHKVEHVVTHRMPLLLSGHPNT